MGPGASRCSPPAPLPHGEGEMRCPCPQPSPLLRSPVAERWVPAALPGTREPLPARRTRQGSEQGKAPSVSILGVEVIRSPTLPAPEQAAGGCRGCKRRSLAARLAAPERCFPERGAGRRAPRPLPLQGQPQPCCRRGGRRLLPGAGPGSERALLPARPDPSPPRRSRSDSPRHPRAATALCWPRGLARRRRRRRARALGRAGPLPPAGSRGGPGPLPSQSRSKMAGGGAPSRWSRPFPGRGAGAGEAGVGPGRGSVRPASGVTGEGSLLPEAPGALSAGRMEPG